jgi:ABC-type multidrug transport system ATPase subunit
MSQPFDRISDEIRMLVVQQRLSPEQMLDVSAIVYGQTESWKEDVVHEINKLIDNWEATMGDSDQSFYSLGLRRAIDIITGQDAYSQLPILETPDTPDEQ